MGLKCNPFIITVELLLDVYIAVDVYVSVFVGRNDVVVSPEDSIVGLNATNEDPKIVGMGNFAVDEYNRFTDSDLKLQRVVEAMFTQSSYMLVIQVADGTSLQPKHYAAVVLVRGDEMKLAAFQEYADPAISI